MKSGTDFAGQQICLTRILFFSMIDRPRDGQGETMKKTMLMIGMLVFATALTAQQGQKGNAVCRADSQKFCKDVKPGQGRIYQCLSANKASLTPECAAHVDEVQKNVKAKMANCQNDIAKFCSTVEPGEGRIYNCLKANEASLEPACKTALTKNNNYKTN